MENIMKLLLAVVALYAALWLILVVGVLAYSFRSIGMILLILSVTAVYLVNKKFRKL